jgi:hypothetical protein
MSVLRILLPVMLCCSACAADDTRMPMAGAGAAASDRHRACVARMYADRAFRERGAVNWNLYDYCMRNPA